MLMLNYTFRIYPDATQQQLMLEWLETCRKVYNYSLRELKDWIASRKSPIDRCSLEREYIIPTDVPFPSYQRQRSGAAQSEEGKPRTQKRLLSSASDYNSQTARHLGGVSKARVWISSLQKVWAVSFFCISAVQEQPHHWISHQIDGSLREESISPHLPPQDWVGAYQQASPHSRRFCGETGESIVSLSEYTVVCCRHAPIRSVGS